MAKAGRVARVLTIVSVTAACAGAPPTDPAPLGGLTSQAKMQTDLGEEFRLGNGESASVGGEGLTVRFNRVTSDARCPVGHQCGADEGDAIVEITVQAPPDEPATFELHTDSARRTQTAYRRYRIRLVRLEPRPVGEQPVPLPQYTGTFVVVFE